MAIRVLLLCSSRFALQTMQELAFFKQLAAVAIPAHCGEWLEHAQAALQGMDVPIIVLEKASYVRQLTAAFTDHNANLALMASFSFRITPELIDLPAQGFFNLHPGPLPAYRGPDPIFWQIRAREPRTGVALHKLDAGWDSGPVVMRELIPLLEDDTYGLVSYKLALVAAKLTQQLIRICGFGLPLPLRAQDGSLATQQPRQRARDVSIRWESMDAWTIRALMNACNPWNKGAATRSGQRVYRFVDGRASVSSRDRAPGTILEFRDDAAIIACAGLTELALNIVSTDEGIMQGSRLPALGLQPGMGFENL